MCFRGVAAWPKTEATPCSEFVRSFLWCVHVGCFYFFVCFAHQTHAWCSLALNKCAQPRGTALGTSGCPTDNPKFVVCSISMPTMQAAPRATPSIADSQHVLQIKVFNEEPSETTQYSVQNFDQKLLFVCFMDVHGWSLSCLGCEENCVYIKEKSSSVSVQLETL